MVRLAPERTLEIVREARSGAIENERQEEFVRGHDGFWLPFHFLASHDLWREFQHIDDFKNPEPDEYPSALVSEDPDDDAAIRIFTPGSEPDTEPDPDEPGGFEEAADRFREVDAGASIACSVGYGVGGTPHDNSSACLTSSSLDSYRVRLFQNSGA